MRQPPGLPHNPKAVSFANSPGSAKINLLRCSTRLAASGWPTAIFKQDLATSGRGQRRFSCISPLTDQDHDWLLATCKGKRDDGPLGIVEPELERVLDLSFQWELKRNTESPAFLGWTRPIVTQGRRYAGSRLGRPFADCDEQVTRFALENNCERLHAVRNWLETHLVKGFHEREFYGHFGVDAFVFRDTDGSLKIKPVVELNPRVTMGHVALALQQRLAPGIAAEFRILSRNEWSSLQPAIDNFPIVQTTGNRLKSGVVLLGDADHRTRLFPLLLIGNEAIRKLRITDRSFLA